jgi:protein TonB
MARKRSRLRTATAVSAVLHAIVIGAILAAASAAGKLPKMSVYRVDIVSPPPQAEGEPNPTPAEPAAAEPEATEPDPEPVAAEPEPPPPEPTLPQPEPTPKPAPPKPMPKAAEAKATQPAEPKPKPPAEKPAERPASKPPQPASTGSEPDPNSPGGEGLKVRTAGEACPSQAYCNNIARQVKRYFRRPSEARSDRGEVCFTLAADGSVDDIRVERLRGSAVFKLALIEAVEQAGLRKEFGRIPGDFDADELHPCVEIVPGS